jgi:magnesium transporter
MPGLPKIQRRRSRRGAAGTVARSPESRLEEIRAEGLTWINVDSPTPEEAQLLADRFGWHELEVEDIVSKRQRPKVDEHPEESYLFVVLHFPVYDKKAQRLNVAELDLFIGQDYLVTITNRKLLPLTRLFSRCEDDPALRENLFAKGSGRLLYEALEDLFSYCFPILDKIAYKLDVIEDGVFGGRSEGVVRDISNVKQEIISYRRIIKPERSTLHVLGRRAESFLPEELELYFDDIVDAAERIWDLLDNYKEVIEALESTNEQVLSHQFNYVLRILTVFSIIFLPATLIASLWGMNVGLPGGGAPVRAPDTAFWIIISVSVAMIVGLLGFFRYKRWL